MYVSSLFMRCLFAHLFSIAELHGASDSNFPLESWHIDIVEAKAEQRRGFLNGA
jgi:hypothetical protein